MTEIQEQTRPVAVDSFVLHWGDLGSRWGVNRSIAQMHALLYLAERPMTAEAIADELGIARSNVSNSLKELLGWKLVRRVPVRGDRRDHYEAETDPWEIARRIAEGRKAREIDPALDALRACAAAAQDDPTVGEVARQRLVDMASFVESVDTWSDQMLTLSNATLHALVRMGARVRRILGRSEG